LFTNFPDLHFGRAITSDASEKTDLERDTIREALQDLSQLAVSLEKSPEAPTQSSDTGA